MARYPMIRRNQGATPQRPTTSPTALMQADNLQQPQMPQTTGSTQRSGMQHTAQQGKQYYQPGSLWHTDRSMPNASMQYGNQTPVRSVAKMGGYMPQTLPVGASNPQLTGGTTPQTTPGAPRLTGGAGPSATANSQSNAAQTGVNVSGLQGDTNQQTQNTQQTQNNSDYTNRQGVDMSRAGSEAKDFANWVNQNGNSYIAVQPDGRVGYWDGSGYVYGNANINNPSSFVGTPLEDYWRKFTAKKTQEETAAKNLALYNQLMERIGPAPTFNRTALDKANAATQAEVARNRGLMLQRISQQGARAGMSADQMMGAQADTTNQFGVQQAQLTAQNEMQAYAKQYEAEMMYWQQRANAAKAMFDVETDQTRRAELAAMQRDAEGRAEQANMRMARYMKDLQDEWTSKDYAGLGISIGADLLDAIIPG